MFKLKLRAFTLVEILLVVLIIGILSSILIVSINPAKQLAEARNVKRRSDTQTILNAVFQYSEDHGFALPTGISTVQKEICKTGAADCTGLVDLSVLTTDQKYLTSLPFDPNGSSTNGAGYDIVRNSSGKAIVLAPKVEQNPNFGLLSCGQKISDADGNQYDTTLIGNQCWMKQNLRVGTMVNSNNTGENHSDQTNDSLVEKYCYDNVASNCNAYGGLYEWQEAMALPSSCFNQDCSAQINNPHRGICPTGWHIPNDVDFNILEKYTVQIAASLEPQYPCEIRDGVQSLVRRCADNNGTDGGGDKGAGKSLKKVGFSSGDDLVGFSAISTGRRIIGGSFSGWPSTDIWESTIDSVTYNAYSRSFNSNTSTITLAEKAKTYGLAVRCLKD